MCGNLLCNLPSSELIPSQLPGKGTVSAAGTPGQQLGEMARASALPGCSQAGPAGFGSERSAKTQIDFVSFPSTVHKFLPEASFYCSPPEFSSSICHPRWDAG